MRDYPNGGFFFIDAAPIQAAGAEGLKIDGIFEDAKRAIEGGKMFVMTNIQVENEGTSVKVSGIPTTVGVAGTVIQGTVTAYSEFLLTITNEDVIIIAND